MENQERYFFIFDEAGTRKTITSLIALIVKLMTEGVASANILFVVPNNVILTCLEEIRSRAIANVVSCRLIQEDILNGCVITESKEEAPFKIDIVGHSVFSSNGLVKKVPSYYRAVISDEVHNLKQRGEESQRESRGEGLTR